jgi:2-polyprenyl-3-methyl-5-hydroxy-6-metoxy-1,4-benzoquinol methylase
VTGLVRLSALEATLGDDTFVPFDPTGAQFNRRFTFDFHRLGDLVALVEANVAEGGKVLDLGAAPYIVTTTLAYRGYEVTSNGLPMDGLDTTGTLTIHAGSSQQTVPLTMFDVEEPFPLESETFDCVVAGEIFEHLYRQPWKLLSESRRVLHPGGTLVLSTPNGHCLESLYSWLKRGSTGMGFNPDAASIRHAREYSLAEIEGVVTNQGFEIDEAFTRTYSHIGKDGFPGRLGTAKRMTHSRLQQLAERPTGLIANRAQTILVVARRASREPGPPPEYMLYGVGDERSGYNFAGENATSDKARTRS